MAIETVAVTGGNGRIGSAILRDLADHGYRTASLDRVPTESDVADESFVLDLLDAGDVYAVLARANADAVVHMGTLTDPLGTPGHVTYESNVMTTYNVLEAATDLGLEAVSIASSVNALGNCFQDEPMAVEYLPVDESHPATPRDPYAIGKLVVETTADGFARRPDAIDRISTLRYPVVADAERLHEMFVNTDRTLDALPDVSPNSAREVFFAYIHVDDAASAARCALLGDYEGHETFWIAASDTTADAPSAAVAAEYYPEAAVRTELDGTDPLVDCGKARRLLDWQPTRSWHDLDATAVGSE